MRRDRLLNQGWKGVLLPGVALFVLGIDQLSKRLVLRHLSLGEPWNPIACLRDLVSLTYVTNTGAAFGLFPDHGVFFIAIAVIVVIAIFAYHRHLPDKALVRASLGLQLGGALGNLTDRVRYGHVIDFIDFKVWPVFNLADSAIVIGVAVLAYYILRGRD